MYTEIVPVIPPRFVQACRHYIGALIFVVSGIRPDLYSECVVDQYHHKSLL